MASSQQETPNMGHRHSLTIETNPLHLLPSNRRFSQADSLRQPIAPVLNKIKKQPLQIPEGEAEKKEKDEKSDPKSN